MFDNDVLFCIILFAYLIIGIVVQWRMWRMWGPTDTFPWLVVGWSLLFIGHVLAYLIGWALDHVIKEG